MQALLCEDPRLLRLDLLSWFRFPSAMLGSLGLMSQKTTRGVPPEARRPHHPRLVHPSSRRRRRAYGSREKRRGEASYRTKSAPLPRLMGPGRPSQILTANRGETRAGTEVALKPVVGLTKRPRSPRRGSHRESNSHERRGLGISSARTRVPHTQAQRTTCPATPGPPSNMQSHQNAPRHAGRSMTLLASRGFGKNRRVNRKLGAPTRLQQRVGT